MPHPRQISLLLWAGPAYVVAWFATGFAAELFGLRDTILFNVLMLLLGILLVAVAFGIWFSLRMLAGRYTPIAALRHIPFGELRLRLDEILPFAAALTVAWPALLYIVPRVVTFPTPGQIFLIQFPGAFSGLLVGWAIWNMPVSRAMKVYQFVTPILLVLAVLLVVGFSDEDPAVALFAQVLGFAYFAWLFITPVWLASLMRQRRASVELAESRSG